MLFSALLVLSILAVRGSAQDPDPPVATEGPPGFDQSDEPTCEGKASGTDFTYTAPAGTVFDVICDEDFPSSNIRDVQSDYFGDCIAICEAELACSIVAYRQQVCYLKSVSDAVLQTSIGVWAARRKVVTTPGDTSPGAPLSCDNKLSDGAYYTDSVRNVHVLIACETYTDFVHLPLGIWADFPGSLCAGASWWGSHGYHFLDV
jgi:hypothetical protein